MISPLAHTRHLFTLAALIALLAAPLALLAADDTAKKDPKQAEEKEPPAVEVYKGRRVAQTMHWLGAEWLVREEREREERASEMLKNLGVKEDMTVCDMGCGNGFHTLKLAKMVGDKGTAIGVDIQQEMLTFLVNRAKEAKIENVKPVLGKLWDPRLEPGSCDIILLVDVYHEFSHPEQMLKAMRAALKPTGRVVLVEFRMEDPNVPIKLLHKMSKEQIMKELPDNGFKLVRQYDELPWQHMMFFERDDSPTEKVEMKPWKAPAKKEGK